VSAVGDTVMCMMALTAHKSEDDSVLGIVFLFQLGRILDISKLDH
jgi:hypothetical protein